MVYARSMPVHTCYYMNSAPDTNKSQAGPKPTNPSALTVFLPSYTSQAKRAHHGCNQTNLTLGEGS